MDVKFMNINRTLNRKNILLKVFCWFSLLFLSASCSLKKDMDTMKDTTVEMGKTTKAVGESSKHIEERTEDFLQLTRPSVSVDALNKRFQDIIDQENPIKKFQQAIEYISSMEMQYWTGTHKDGVEQRNSLINESLRIFLSDIDSLIDDEYPLNTPLLFGKNKWLVLSSFAAALSEVAEYQKLKSKQVGFKTYTVYDAFKDALKMENSINAGQEAPEYIHTILEYKQQVIYLLQLRHNYYPFIVATMISDIEDNNPLTLYLQKFHEDWFVDISGSNNLPYSKDQYKRWTSYLRDMQETQKFLQALGIPVERNIALDDLFGGLHLWASDFSPFESLLQKIDYNPNRYKENYIALKEGLVNVDLQPENSAQEFLIMMNKMMGTSLFLFPFPHLFEKPKAAPINLDLPISP